MENFLRKYGWALTLGLIALGSTLVALTANNFLASMLAPFTVPELPAAENTAAPAPTRNTNARTWDQAIAKLCLFGCVDAKPVEECPGGCPDGESCQAGQCVPDQEEIPIDLDVPVLSDLRVQLLGAMVATNPDYSIALVRDDTANTTLVLGVGDPLGTDAEIIEIRRDRIYLQRNGRLEYIRMDKTLGGAPDARAQAGTSGGRTTSNTQRPERTRTPPPPGPPPASIQQTDDGQFQIQRQALEQQLKDQKTIASQGQFVPNMKDGERNGLRMVGVSPNSIYTQLGIQSGDILRTLNGKEVNTSQEAMNLFNQLQSSGTMTVEIERRGQKKRLQYKIE